MIVMSEKEQIYFNAKINTKSENKTIERSSQSVFYYPQTIGTLIDMRQIT